MNGPDTHSAFIQFPSGGHAFIDGIPDDCTHDWTGDTVHFTASGRTIYWHTHRQYASFTAPLRDRLIYEKQTELGDPVTGGAVTCRKCKKIFSPDIHSI